MWYIIPHTKTKRSRTHGTRARVHTRRLFFWDVSIRNSLRSNYVPDRNGARSSAVPILQDYEIHGPVNVTHVAKA